MTDPRVARTLDEASKNPDGTYNGVKALAWLSEVLSHGHGITEAEIRAMFEAEKKRRQEAHSGNK